MLTALIIIFAITVMFVFFASIIPISQYIYYRFIKKDQCSIKYYFSEQLFDRHMSHDVGLSDIRVINNRRDLGKLWEIEVTYDLP